MSVGLDVADEDDGDVGGNVIGIEESVGIGSAEAFDVGRPTDRGAAIGMGFDGCGSEEFDELALGIGLGTHAALFANDIPFPIEIAEDGFEKAARFEQEPEFGAVGGEAVVIVRGILTGLGVETDTAIFLNDGGIEVGDDEGGGAVHGGLHVEAEDADFVGIRARSFGELFI